MSLPEKDRKERGTQLQKYLELSKPKLAHLLPKHIGIETFFRKSAYAVSKNPELLECDLMTVVMAIAEAASLGLEPTGGVLQEAFLVPYNTKQRDGTWKKVCQLIPGYAGLRNLALRTGDVADFDPPVCVFSCDEFLFKRGEHPVLEHTPNIASPHYDEPEHVTAAYAVATMHNGRRKWDVTTRKTLDKIRNSSKASKSDYSPWNQWTIEMYRKTALRRLCKALPKSGEFARALALEDSAEAAADEGRAFASEQVIDVLGIPADEPAPTRTASAKDAIAAKAAAASPAPQHEETEDERNQRLAQEEADRAGV